MDEGMYLEQFIALLAVVAIMMSMLVGMSFGMSRKHIPWFFGLAFGILAGIMFRGHWAAGTFVLIFGMGSVAILVGIDRKIERDKAKKQADGTEPKP